MTQYRYQLERYRGRNTRHVCPQCGRKNVFTRYIDTYNNNIYINDIVGKCNRLDKCGYHYTPHQYFTDNPWKRDNSPGEGGALRPWKRDKETRPVPLSQNIGFWNGGTRDRMTCTPPPRNYGQNKSVGILSLLTLKTKVYNSERDYRNRFFI